MVDANREIVRRYREARNAGDLSALDALIARHVVKRRGSRIMASDLAGFKESVTRFRAAFPDAQQTIDDLIAEGDRVVVHSTARGTHRREFLGIGPTGRHATWSGVNVYRLAEGRIVEDLDYWDALGLLQQLGGSVRV